MNGTGLLDAENLDIAGDPALAAVVDGLGQLRAEQRAGWSSAARSARVLELGQIGEVANAELVLAVSEWDGAGEDAADGSISSSSWLAHRVPMTRAAAARLVASARLTQRCDRVATALTEGRTTVSHVEQIARAIRRREDIFATHGDELLDAAEKVKPEEFRECAAKWRSLADDLVGSIDDPYDNSRDELTLSPTSGGLAIRGWFHTAAGVEKLNLIDRYQHPDPVRGERPPRTLRERRAAALLAILFGHREYGAKNIAVTIDERTMRGAWPEDLIASRSDVDGYGPVPAELIRSWLTNAAAPPRRHERLRDRRPWHGRPFRLAGSEAHAQAPRRRLCGPRLPAGGRTSLDELAQVCRTHYGMTHRAGSLYRDTGGTWHFEPLLPPYREPPGTH